MCIVFVVTKPSPEYKLYQYNIITIITDGLMTLLTFNIYSALAMNRDESFDRSTASLQYWPDLDVYCGKDLDKNGTWLAINKKGKFKFIYMFI